MKDIEDLDNYELDLLDLINSDLNTTNQYLVFEGSNEEVYAINVSKVIEVLVYKKLDMVKNGNGETLIKATAKIRDDIASIICFDEWFGNKVLNEEDYEFVVLAGFGGHNLAIMVKDVDYIVHIDFDEMIDNSLNNNKTNFVAKIKLNGKERLCTIFDGDKLLLDIFSDTYKIDDLENITADKKIDSQKYVLFADDSRFIRKMVKSTLEKMNIKSKVFENGKDLFEELKKLKPEDIALIVTDLEMPIMDGRSLIKNIKDLNMYKDINIIVHTNMSNFVIESSLLDLGAKEVIGKIDMEKLTLGINKYFVK